MLKGLTGKLTKMREMMGIVEIMEILEIEGFQYKSRNPKGQCASTLRASGEKWMAGESGGREIEGW